MHVSLTPQLEDYVQQKIATGRYNNASEVMREALRVLIEREEERETKLQALRQAIQDSIKSGPSIPLDIEAIIGKARQERDSEQGR